MVIERKITLEEAGVILKNMKNNKSPGSTGFTAESYKFFLERSWTFCCKLWVPKVGNKRCCS